MHAGRDGWDRRDWSANGGWRRRSRRRVRSRRLTPRGRFTLVALFTLFSLSSWMLGARWVTAAAHRAPEPLPPVSAGRAPAPQPPPEIFDRLPLGMGDRHVEGEGSGPGARLVEEWPLPGSSELAGPLRVEYTLDAHLGERIERILRRRRAPKGHAIVMEPATGRVLAYVSSEPDLFPATRAYPAASLVKIVTAAAALHHAPQRARSGCRYRGNPYRLSRSRLRPPRQGREASLERALATSNNQCFAQLAVHAVGAEAMHSALERFGWLDPPAPGHAAGTAELGDDDYDLGRLGCGLRGCRITPLHGALLAASLATGELVEPRWIARVRDARGRELALPPRRGPRRIMTRELADELRTMLVRTTTRGTARSAFRDRRGRPKLGPVRVAGKTGNVSGDDPEGRYEWFAGIAPADAPRVAVAVLQVHDDLWWVKSSEIAAEVLSEIFCERGRCAAELADRYTGAVASGAQTAAAGARTAAR